MAEENKEFVCNSKMLADYFVKHGSKLLKIENGVFVFEYDDSINVNLKQFEIDYKKCMF